MHLAKGAEKAAAAPITDRLRDPLKAELERGQGQAWQYQLTRRSLFAQPVHGWFTRRDPLCQGAWHADRPWLARLLARRPTK
jgi:hypothetical protein